MPKQYNHLNQEERELLAQYRCEGKSLGFIAKALGRNKSSISRELSRNASIEYSRYTPCRAHARATHRWVAVHRRPRLKNDLIRQYVVDNLEEGWSPEQIAGRLPIDHPGQIISHEAIYQYIYDLQTEIRLELIQHLRRAHKKRKNKGIGRKEKKTKIPNRKPIDARPKAVEDRKQYGHWEGDTLVADTVGFNDRGATRIPGGGVRGPDSHLVERYRLLDGGARLSATFTWNDPKTFQKPHTYEFRYYRIKKINDPRILACDPGDQERARFVLGPDGSR